MGTHYPRFCRIRELRTPNITGQRSFRLSNNPHSVGPLGTTPGPVELSCISVLGVTSELDKSFSVLMCTPVYQISRCAPSVLVCTKCTKYKLELGAHQPTPGTGAGASASSNPDAKQKSTKVKTEFKTP